MYIIQNVLVVGYLLIGPARVVEQIISIEKNMKYKVFSINFLFILFVL
jgi:hypothetical protein